MRVSAEILGRVTAPGTSYSPEFVAEFRTFHGELEEFFNATALEKRLRSLANRSKGKVAEAIHAFLAMKAEGASSNDHLLQLLKQLTVLRQLFTGEIERAELPRRSRLRLADIGLEDHAFTLLSECAEPAGQPFQFG